MEIHNILSSRILHWLSPKAVKDGYTPDISVFCFYVWEPIWYLNGDIKQPQNNLLKGRWLGFAWSSGDALNYYIETERPKSEGHHVVLIRSLVKNKT